MSGRTSYCRKRWPSSQRRLVELRASGGLQGCRVLRPDLRRLWSQTSRRLDHHKASSAPHGQVAPGASPASRRTAYGRFGCLNRRQLAVPLAEQLLRAIVPAPSRRIAARPRNITSQVAVLIFVVPINHNRRPSGCARCATRFSAVHNTLRLSSLVNFKGALANF